MRAIRRILLQKIYQLRECCLLYSKGRDVVNVVGVCIGDAERSLHPEFYLEDALGYVDAYEKNDAQKEKDSGEISGRLRVIIKEAHDVLVIKNLEVVLTK